MRKDPELTAKLQKIIGKSKKLLVIAKQHYAQENYDEAASRAYCAVFHSLQAVLLTLKLSFSRHSSVIGSFNKEFLHKGVFPKEFGKKIERMFRDRQIGDYGFEETVTKAYSEQDVADAETIVNAIEKHLVDKGFI